jgi:hypothetical protein
MAVLVIRMDLEQASNSQQRHEVFLGEIISTGQVVNGSGTAVGHWRPEGSKSFSNYIDSPKVIVQYGQDVVGSIQTSGELHDAQHRVVGNIQMMDSRKVLLAAGFLFFFDTTLLTSSSEEEKVIAINSVLHFRLQPGKFRRKNPALPRRRKSQRPLKPKHLFKQPRLLSLRRKMNLPEWRENLRRREKGKRQPSWLISKKSKHCRHNKIPAQDKAVLLEEQC